MFLILLFLSCGWRRVDINTSCVFSLSLFLRLVLSKFNRDCGICYNKIKKNLTNALQFFISLISVRIVYSASIGSGKKNCHFVTHDLTHYFYFCFCFCDTFKTHGHCHIFFWSEIHPSYARMPRALTCMPKKIDRKYIFAVNIYDESHERSDLTLTAWI